MIRCLIPDHFSRADKLAQTKLTEKAQREAYKQQLREKKATKVQVRPLQCLAAAASAHQCHLADLTMNACALQERLAEAAAMRRIRQLNGNSKRARVDERKVGNAIICFTSYWTPRWRVNCFLLHMGICVMSTLNCRHKQDATVFMYDSIQAAKKQAHAATGFTCEHGIWRCSICVPRTTGRK